MRDQSPQFRLTAISRFGILDFRAFPEPEQLSADYASAVEFLELGGHLLHEGVIGGPGGLYGRVVRRGHEPGHGHGTAEAAADFAQAGHAAAEAGADHREQFRRRLSVKQVGERQKHRLAAVVAVQKIVAGPFSPCFGGKVRGQLYLEIHSGSKVDDFRPDCKSGRTERLPSACRIAANQAERLPNGDLMANQAERLSDRISGGTLRKACLFEAAASDEAAEQGSGRNLLVRYGDEIVQEVHQAMGFAVLRTVLGHGREYALCMIAQHREFHQVG